MMKHTLFALLASVLIVACAISPARAQGLVAEADFTPWSGYWWPAIEGGLSTGQGYNGHPAPIERYETLLDGTPSGPVRVSYEEQLYDPEGLSWWGLCYAWACASIIETYDIEASSYENVVFQIGDKKGLLTLAHTDDEYISADGTNPVNFHYWLLNYVQDQRVAFAADLDAGEAVWYYPIYKFEMTEKPGDGYIDVSVLVSFADDNVHPDFDGTQTKVREYTYRLHTSQDGVIMSGEWTGYSVDQHPDELVQPILTKSLCPDLDIELTRQIAQHTDDDAESLDLYPGTYNLVLDADTTYRVRASSGDALLLNLKRVNRGGKAVRVVLRDGLGDVITDEMIADRAVHTYSGLAQGGDFLLEFTQPDYEESNEISMQVAVEKNFSQRTPYHYKSFWEGLVVRNPGETPREAWVVIQNEFGEPLQTVFAAELAPGEKRIFFPESFARNSEKPYVEQNVVLSDQAMEVFYVQAKLDNSNLVLYQQGDARGTRVVLPDILATTAMRGGVVNESLETNEVLISAYGPDGSLRKTIQQTLAPGQRYEIEPGLHPWFGLSNDGWIEMQSLNALPISGYGFLRHNLSSSSEGFFAYEPASGPQYVVHVEADSGWSTTLSLVNPGDTELNVTIRPLVEGMGATIPVAIPAKGRTKLDLRDYDLAVQDWSSMLEITADGVFHGQISYDWGGELATSPLLRAEHLGSTLDLAHFPNDGGWWTGICLGNMGAEPVTVDILPYSAEELLLQGLQGSITIEPGQYGLFELRGFFGSGAGEVSHVVFAGPEGSKLGGIFVYGWEGDSMLTSGYLHPRID